ncbi:ADP-sugar pyrophosphatase [Frankliniella occidentalis]|uniref:ADP-sugar pyrophosphatase n=1 Tax=Frankliniella occidentalis TaxID=133901 RepID=A0A6J1SB21_FRAOC|nr:ADP-sugar pyrophosphatase [Frankliniella occidentalis]
MNVDAMSMRLRAEEREEILDEMSVPLAMPRKLSHNTSDTTDDGSRVIGEKVLARGDWLELSQRTYVDPDGASRVWEGCSRLNRTPGSRIDNVMVIAWYRRMLHYDCVVLVKQFRPALNAHTIEVPSGLVLENETHEQSAERELLECTGFLGTSRKVGPILAADPSMSGSSLRIVTVEVNGDEPGNNFINARAAGERHKVPILVPVSELLEKLRAFAQAGFIIDSRIDAFAIGLVMGNSGRKIDLNYTTSMPAAAPQNCRRRC